MTEREERHLRLCRRLLSHNEGLHAENRGLYEKLCWLAEEYRCLMARFEQVERDNAAKEQTADILFGAAIDELLIHRAPSAESS